MLATGSPPESPPHPPARSGPGTGTSAGGGSCDPAPSRLAHRPTVLLPGSAGGGRAAGAAQMGEAVNPKVDAYVGASKRWPEEIAELRPILLRERR